MSGPRNIRHAPEALALKVASKALVRAAGGGEAAAETAGSRQPHMSDCGNQYTPDFLRIDHVAALEDVTAGAVGHPHVTRALAARQGFLLFRKPDAIPAGANLLQLIAKLAKEHGEIAGAVCSSLGDDNRVDRAEAGRIRAEIADEMRGLVELDAALGMIEAGERA